MKSKTRFTTMVLMALVLILLTGCPALLGTSTEENDESGGGGVEIPSTIFIAVGNGGRIMTSADGETWTDETETGDTFLGIVYGNNKFVAVGNNGRIMISTDGETWIDETEIGDSFFDIA